MDPATAATAPERTLDRVLTAVTSVLDDDRVMAAVGGARSALAELHRHRANRRGWGRSAAVGSVMGARASAAMDGAVLDGPLTANVTDPVLAGALRAAAAVGSLVGVWERAPVQALATLHREAAAGIVPADQLGRPRHGAPMLVMLAEVCRSGTLPGPVAGAVVHLVLSATQPFSGPNGVVARAATRLSGIASGLDPHGLGVPEVGYWRSATELHQVAGAAGAPGADELAMVSWIELSCRCLQAGAREGRAIADAGG